MNRLHPPPALFWCFLRQWLHGDLGSSRRGLQTSWAPEIDMWIACLKKWYTANFGRFWIKVVIHQGISYSQTNPTIKCEFMQVWQHNNHGDLQLSVLRFTMTLQKGETFKHASRNALWSPAPAHSLGSAFRALNCQKPSWIMAYWPAVHRPCPASGLRVGPMEN